MQSLKVQLKSSGRLDENVNMSERDPALDRARIARVKIA
jgi:hypothetical protein